jgi:hypothetical protein
MCCLNTYKLVNSEKLTVIFFFLVTMKMLLMKMLHLKGWCKKVTEVPNVKLIILFCRASRDH